MEKQPRKRTIKAIIRNFEASGCDIEMLIEHALATVQTKILLYSLRQKDDKLKIWQERHRILLEIQAAYRNGEYK